ncbi:MAG: hypothetical protein PHP45_01430 [Elusimicrobiales bacterium]|nr:hypothetical protein [Elusimicrobiales bacterium]
MARHTNAQRRFQADEFFARLPAHTLYLETSPDRLQEILRRIDEGEPEVQLTFGPRNADIGVDIARTVRAARSANGGVRVIGPDAREGVFGRDDIIARGIRESFVPGGLHVALFGAMHCSNTNSWFYGKLLREPGPLNPKRMLSVSVYGKFEDAVSPLTFFRKKLGLGTGTVVLANPSGLDAWFLKWFPAIGDETRTYGAVIMFDTDK